MEVISLVLLLLVLFEAGLIAITGNWFWRLLKIKLGKGKGYVWIVKVYRDGTVDLEVEKQKELVSFGKGEEADKSTIIGIYHYERASGIPVHFVIQGKSYNVNLLQEYPPETTSKLVNQALARAHQQGILEGMRAAIQKALSDPKTLVLLILILLAAGGSAYLTYQVYTMLKKGIVCKLAQGGAVLIKGG